MMLKRNQIMLAAALVLVMVGCASGGAGAPASNASAALNDLPAGDAAAGEALFSGAQPGPNGEELPCQVCHTLNGADGVGPSLKEVSARVPEGYDTVEAYLYESITQPDTYIRSGFGSHIMPQFSNNQLDDQTVADLIAYLAQQ